MTGDAVGSLALTFSEECIIYITNKMLKVFAAIPAVIFGKGDTLWHVVKGRSIVLPFQTGKGSFVIDVCLQC
jgi:hypothetical protein